MPKTNDNFTAFQTYIRQFEAQLALKPLSLSYDEKTQQITATFPKTVLFMYDPLADDDRNVYRAIPIYHADHNVNTQEYARYVQAQLALFHDGIPTVDVVNVHVTENAKLCPMPVAHCEMKGTTRNATRVRGYRDLATQPVTMRMTFSAAQLDNTEANTLALAKILKVATMSYGNLLPNGYRLPDAGRRASQDFLTNFMNCFSCLIPSRCSQKLPDRVVAAARPNRYESIVVPYVLDTSYANAGVLANASNVVTFVGAAILAAILLCLTCGESMDSGATLCLCCDNGERTLSDEYNTAPASQTTGNSQIPVEVRLASSRDILLAATKTKIVSAVNAEDHKKRVTAKWAKNQELQALTQLSFAKAWGMFKPGPAPQVMEDHSRSVTDPVATATVGN